MLHGRFWAEEGRIHFGHMLENKGPASLFFTYGHSGYFDAFVNGGTWLAAQVPLARAPLVTVWLSLGVIASLLWITLYWPSALLPTMASRIVAAVLLIVGTVAIPEVWLNSLEAQVYLALITVLLLFVKLRSLSRTRFVFGGVVLATAGLSGVYADLLAPLFIARAVMQRTRRSIVYALVSSISAAIQLVVVVYLRLAGDTGGTKLVARGPTTLLRNVASYHVVGFLFGPDNAGTAHRHARSSAGLAALTVFAIVVFVVVVAIAARSADRRIAIALGCAFVITEIGVNFGAGADSGGRFAVVPIGILILTLVHASFAGRRGVNVFGAGLCAVVFLFGLTSFWTYQSANLRCQGCPDWTQQVQAWQQGQTTRLKIWPYPTWYITVPRRSPSASTSTSR